MPVNHTWGIDLTTVTVGKKHKTILGIIDHGTRMNLSLTELPSKHSMNILRELSKTIRQYGVPRFIRTDNERCFNAKIIRLALKLLGIKHQKSDIACPWQNGRIERFFGTFKEKVKQVIFTNPETFQTELNTFNIWYNHCRTHEHIGGLTPKEMWLKRRDRNVTKAVWVNDWNGILTGYYFPD
ncbi:MAG: putative transposase [Phenylobacterium sp.]|jgi:putative transposase